MSTITGSAASETLNGAAGDDTISGLAGLDFILGSGGNDVLIGGLDDDAIVGGAGDDIYQFNLGDGHDSYDCYSIVDHADRVVFGAGITQANIKLTRQGGDLVITFSNSPNDSICILNHFTQTDSVLSTLQFSDSSTLNIAPTNLSNIVYSTGSAADNGLLGYDGVDVMSAGEGNDEVAALAGSDSVDGGLGRDNLFGGLGNDSLNGGLGNDTLQGEESNDTLIGGLGDDLLIGGDGADIYFYSLGDGQDVIANFAASPGADKITLNSGITLANIKLNREVNDLIITFSNSANDSIRVTNHFLNSTYQLNTLLFSDGSTLDLAPTNLANIVYSKGANNTYDALPGYAGIDVINGYGNNDTLYAVGGNDTVDGGQGSDTVDGGEGNDSLLGGTGADTLAGAAGNDVLLGGADDDVLVGGEGADVYKYSLGDGNDKIVNDQATASADKILFGAGITLANIKLTRVGYDLIISFTNSSTDSIRIIGQLSGDNSYVLNTLQFSDATTLSISPLTLSNVITSPGSPLSDMLDGYGGRDILLGGNGDDQLIAAGGNDSLDGGQGGDYLEADEGNDTLLGGAGTDALLGSDGTDLLTGGIGDDTLQGGEGADSYFFNAGDGQDFIYNLQTVAAADKIVFGAGITAANIHQFQDGNDLVITFDGNGGDLLHIVGQFDGDVPTELHTLQFSDATTLTLTTTPLSLPDYVAGTRNSDSLSGDGGNNLFSAGVGADEIIANAGNDTLNGDAGNDSLYGGDGNDLITGGRGDDYLQGDEGVDSYVFNKLDGNDTLYNYQTMTVTTDKIVFGAGITAANIRLNRQGDDLIITLTNSSTDSIRISNQYTSVAYQLNTLQFADASTLNINPTNLTNLVYSTGTSAPDALTGYDGTDSMSGSGDDDDLIGLGGDDTLNGGAGADSLLGGDGNDSLVGSVGADTLSGDDGADSLSGGTGDDFLQGGLGADRYQFNLGDGQDRIDNNQAAAAADEIVLGAGITAANIKLLREGNDLLITFSNSANDSIRVINQYGAGTSYRLGILRFSDATALSISPSTLTNTVYSNGSAFNDGFTGYAGNDVMIGLAGVDGMDAGGGNDLLDGGSGADNMNGEAGNDTVLGGTGDDNLNGGDGTDQLTGGTGDDYLQGGLGADSYFFALGDGTDRIDNSSAAVAADKIVFAAGITAANIRLTKVGSDLLIRLTNSPNDSIRIFNQFSNPAYVLGTLQFSDATTMSISPTVLSNIVYSTGSFYGDSLAGYAGIDSMSGGDGSDSLDGDSGNDTLLGGAGGDVMQGGSGNDRLDGGLSADQMMGGIGNDTFIVDNALDVISESIGEGTDTVQSSVTFTLGTDVENLTLTGTQAINATGNTLANQLTGNSNNNTLQGLDGNDTLSGGAGADTLQGGAGNDSYVVDAAGDVVTESSGAGTDTVQSSISYTLGNYLENLTLTGTGTRNGVGNAGANVLTGNSGNNKLDGGAGNDTLLGGLGDDTYVVDVAGDVVTESASSGTDTVQSAVSYTLGINVENLTLTGTGTRNGVGNGAANVMTGNSGNNVLTGDLGSDSYSLSRTSAKDTLVDVGGSNDQLLFASDVASNQLWFKHVGNDLVIDIIGTANTATIKNWYIGGTTNHIETFKSGNGKTLTDDHVQNLVNAMAGMTEPPSGQTSLTPAQQTALNPVLAANWT